MKQPQLAVCKSGKMNYLNLGENLPSLAWPDITKYNTLGVKKWKFTVSQFGRLEVGDQGVGRIGFF